MKLMQKEWRVVILTALFAFSTLARYTKEWLVLHSQRRKKGYKVSAIFHMKDKEYTACTVDAGPGHIVLRLYDEKSDLYAYVIDGRVGSQWYYYLGEILFSPNGQYAYGVGLDEHSCLDTYVVDDAEEKVFDEVSDFTFFGDGHWCYVAVKGNRESVVVDGKEEGWYQSIDAEVSQKHPTRIATRGNDYAYKAIKNKTYGKRSMTYVVNGVAAKCHEYVNGFIFFGKAQGRYLYKVRSRRENAAIVVDGKQGSWFRQIVWSDVSGDNYAYKGDKEIHGRLMEAYVVNGVRGKWYNEIAWPAFHGNNHVYDAIIRPESGGVRSLFVINGKELRLRGIQHSGAIAFHGDKHICSGTTELDDVHHIFYNGKPIGVSCLEVPEFGFTKNGKPWAKGKVLLNISAM